jgi:ATP-binding cassette subfamily B protein/subfamily B ATP-binding cassette protein MsbA
VLKRLFPYWRAARGRTVAGVAALLAAGGLELLQPWPVKWLVDNVLGTRPISGWMIGWWPGDKNGALLTVCGAIVVLALAHKLAQMLSQLLLIRAGLALVRELRCGVTDHLHRLALRQHDARKVGDSVYRALYDSFAAQTLLSQAIAPMIAGSVLLIGVLAVMLRMDVALTLIALAVTPMFWLMIRSFGAIIERRTKAYQEVESGLYAQVLETLGAIRAVKSFSREKLIADRFAASADRSVALNRKLSFAQVAFTTAVALAMAAGTAAVVYIGARRVMQGHLSTGDVLIFLAYTGMLYTPVNSFTQGLSVMRSARTQLGRVFELLDAPQEVVARPDVVQPVYERAMGRIELRDVRFAYEPGREVLHGVDAAVERGTVVAIVGRTGSGKSTLASLLMRFYDVTGGAIRLDGTDLRDLPLAWLRNQVTLVMQEPVLFAGTIAENVAFGREGATAADIVRAAEMARADEFIRKLPDGYETQLGERGVNLSGGQRQRLAVARAFLRDTPIVILDEPTSSVDGQTEGELVESIRSLARGRTTFVIAHRLTTVRSADVVWVMEAGRIVERGTHEELIDNDTTYRRLYAGQDEPPSSPVVAQNLTLSTPI